MLFSRLTMMCFAAMMTETWYHHRWQTRDGWFFRVPTTGSFTNNKIQIVKIKLSFNN